MFNKVQLWNLNAYRQNVIPQKIKKALELIKVQINFGSIFPEANRTQTYAMLY